MATSIVSKESFPAKEGRLPAVCKANVPDPEVTTIERNTETKPAAI